MIKTICAFASGKEINFKKLVNFIETDMFMDFNKDVKCYGFSLSKNMSVNFDNASIINITIFSDSIFNCIIEFKSKNSNTKVKKKVKLHTEQNNIRLKLPKLYSKIDEITLYFPKSLNSYAADGTIPFIRFEKIELK